MYEPDLAECELTEPEDCKRFQENEHNCATCDNWNNCWGESPWTEANRVWYGRDHIGI
jgi:hypothetical protein